MAVAVFALWTLITMERTALRRAATDANTSLQTIERLRERAVPASQPETPFSSSFSEAS